MEGDSNQNHPGSGDSRSLDYQWSNIECTKIALEAHFPNAVKDKTVQKNIINRFYNFYLGSRVQKGIDVQDLVYSTISIMPLHEETEEFIFREWHYKEGGTLFSLTPEEKLRAEIKQVAEKTAKLNEKESKPEDEKLNAEEPKLGVEKAEETFNDDNQTQSQGVENEHGNNSVLEVNEETQNLMQDTETVVNISSDNDQEPEGIEPENVEPKETFTEPMDNEENIKHLNLKIPENIRWFSNKRKRPEHETNPPQYGPVENAAFTASCKKLLDVWDTNEDARIVLKYFFGVVALILMRATTKTYKHLVNTFSSNKFLKNLPEKPGIRYSIPHKKCLKSCFRTFTKRDGSLRVMFAKLVVNSVYIDSERMEQRNGGNTSRFTTMNMFKVTILAHTANYGLGLLSMVQTLHDKLGVEDLSTVVEVTYCEQTAESWRNIKKFIDKYMVDTSKEHTHYWARLINGDYFRSLCCNSNHVLAVILAVFIEKTTETSGVWQSTWVGRVENLETLKELAREMYTKYMDVRKEKTTQFIMQFVDNLFKPEEKTEQEASEDLKTEKLHKEFVNLESVEEITGHNNQNISGKFTDLRSSESESNYLKPGTSHSQQSKQKQNKTWTKKSEIVKTLNYSMEDFQQEERDSDDFHDNITCSSDFDTLQQSFVENVFHDNMTCSSDFDTLQQSFVENDFHDNMTCSSDFDILQQSFVENVFHDNMTCSSDFDILQQSFGEMDDNDDKNDDYSQWFD